MEQVNAFPGKVHDSKLKEVVRVLEKRKVENDQDQDLLKRRLANLDLSNEAKIKAVEDLLELRDVERSSNLRTLVEDLKTTTWDSSKLTEIEEGLAAKTRSESDEISKQITNVQLQKSTEPFDDTLLPEITMSIGRKRKEQDLRWKKLQALVTQQIGGSPRSVRFEGDPPIKDAIDAETVEQMQIMFQTRNEGYDKTLDAMQMALDF